MPTIGVYLSNATYAKQFANHGNGIGKHLSHLADADVFGNPGSPIDPGATTPVSALMPKKRIIDKKTGEILKNTEKLIPGTIIPVEDPENPTQEEIDNMVGGL